MAEVLILSPSFGQWSERPSALLAEAGVCVRAARPGPPLSSAELQETIGDADALIVGLDDVDAAAIASGPKLRVIAKHGVGVDNIDVAAAAAQRVTVVNAPGTNSTAVADLVLGLILALARNIVPAHQSVVAGRWEKFNGPELQAKTLGLIGFGRIGQAVARRAGGFDMNVVAYDPYAPESVFEAVAVTRREDLDELLAEADVVSLHMPGSGSGPLLDADRLNLLKPTALLINAARGELVDEAAVAQALEAKRLGGYAADAFFDEPPTGSPLLDAPRVVLTPHIGAFTDRANELMGVTVVTDILAVLDGHAPAHPVTPPKE